MLFNSPEFLFLFLPLFIFAYFCVSNFLRNIILLIASLLFYFLSSGELTYVLALSILLNWILGLLLIKVKTVSKKKLILAIGILLNLLPLVLYKYVDFIINIINIVTAFFGANFSLKEFGLSLPVGISFFTFQAISYLVDIASGLVRPIKSVFDFGMYHTSFPQLIAGPIVRYSDVSNEIRDRETSIDDIHNGIVQFGFGLGKKVIFADNLGRIADEAFALSAGDRGIIVSWIGIVAYSLQIYYDFSGYSDMAIGLGRILGFHFPENFNQPYLSKSITEFWRRWHLTLSRWFRDYLYFPLGGSRLGLAKTLRNLFIVFILCGLWHGASINFIIWGLCHGSLLVIERLGSSFTSWRPPKLLARIYTILGVLIAWVFFRANNTQDALLYLNDMFLSYSTSFPLEFYSVLTPERLFYLLLSLLFALIPFDKLLTFERKKYKYNIYMSLISLVIFVVSVGMMAQNGFSPFIYFKF